MLPPGEPPYVTSLEEVAWGLVLTAVTILIHGVATTWSIVATSPRSASGPTRPIRDLGRIIALAELIVLIHLVEVLVWAAFFYWGGNFENPSIAYYFALLEYTTVGSSYNLHTRWRFLEGLIAICGLLTFAWSTGVLMTAVQGVQDRSIAERLRNRGSQKASEHRQIEH
jgi:hypothetical protein